MRVGSVLPAQAGHLGLHHPMVNRTRLSRSGAQCPLHHLLTTALGGRLGNAFGHDHPPQQKWNLSEEGWQGENQPAGQRTKVRQKKSLTWERQNPPRLYGNSNGSHGCPFLLVGSCSEFACSDWTVVPAALQASVWASPLCPTTVHGAALGLPLPGHPGADAGQPGQGSTCPGSVRVPRCPNKQSSCFHTALS